MGAVSHRDFTTFAASNERIPPNGIRLILRNLVRFSIENWKVYNRKLINL
jgi:hypothetical protein